MSNTTFPSQSQRSTRTNSVDLGSQIGDWFGDDVVSIADTDNTLTIGCNTPYASTIAGSVMGDDEQYFQGERSCPSSGFADRVEFVRSESNTKFVEAECATLTVSVALTGEDATKFSLSGLLLDDFSCEAYREKIMKGYPLPLASSLAQRNQRLRSLEQLTGLFTKLEEVVTSWTTHDSEWTEGEKRLFKSTANDQVPELKAQKEGRQSTVATARLEKEAIQILSNPTNTAEIMHCELQLYDELPDGFDTTRPQDFLLKLRSKRNFNAWNDSHTGIRKGKGVRVLPSKP